jgi:hypothetical protein
MLLSFNVHRTDEQAQSYSQNPGNFYAVQNFALFLSSETTTAKNVIIISYCSSRLREWTYMEFPHPREKIADKRYEEQNDRERNSSQDTQEVNFYLMCPVTGESGLVRFFSKLTLARASSPNMDWERKITLRSCKSQVRYLLQ